MGIFQPLLYCTSSFFGNVTPHLIIRYGTLDSTPVNIDKREIADFEHRLNITFGSEDKLRYEQPKALINF